MSMRDSTFDDLERAIKKLDKHDHLCLLYKTQEEQFSTVIPFIKIGLEQNEKCLYIVDDNTASTVIKEMIALDIDVNSAVESGKLTIANKQESYLKRGYFDPNWMLEFLKRATNKTMEEGYSALRITGEMTWVLGGDPGTERLMEYEAKLNYFFPENNALAICQYNSNRFPPEIIKDVIFTHPLVIYGGMVCKNFYYIPPDDFLEGEQSAKEIERLLFNIKNRERIEAKLHHYQERLEELVKERTAELRLMNERFTLATNAARLGVWDWDLQKNELVWDERMNQLYSIDRKDFISSYDAWLNLLHPEDRASCNEILKQARSGEREYDTEFRIVWSDGSIHYLKAHGMLLKDTYGKPLRMTGINYDITERKQAEVELQEQMAEIKYLNEIMLGREEKMIELKKEINLLLEKEGKQKKYDVN